MLKMIANEPMSYRGEMLTAEQSFDVEDNHGEALRLYGKARYQDGSPPPPAPLQYQTRMMTATAKRGRGRPAGSPNKPKGE